MDIHQNGGIDHVKVHHLRNLLNHLNPEMAYDQGHWKSLKIADIHLEEVDVHVEKDLTDRQMSLKSGRG